MTFETQRPRPSRESTELKADFSQPEVVEAQPELSAEEIKSNHDELWQSGDKVGALEAVLGRYVNSSEVSDNPILQTVIMAHSAEEAYGAAMMIKTIETSQDQQD